MALHQNKFEYDFVFPFSGEKTLWWKEKVSSLVEIDGAADHETHVSKTSGPISSNKTLQRVEKTPPESKKYS